MTQIFVKNQKQIQEILDLKSSKKQVKSSHLSDYHYFFSDCQKIDELHLQKKLFNSQIHFQQAQSDESKFNFRISQMTELLTAQVYQVKLCYGNFSLKIKLLIVPQILQLKNFYLYQEGAFGTIYLAYDCLKEQTFVIKTFHVSKKQKWKSILMESIKQYFMGKLIQTLQIGPKINKNFGFDIVSYSNCIFFTMEFCSDKKQNTQKIQKDLKLSLKILHTLGIVHLDIKPSNIAFSNRLNKYIFIDFGFTSIISQKIGYKTLTPFIGTYEYCSDQMKKTIQGQNLVDLYYNDVKCLKKSLNYIQNIQRFDQIHKKVILQHQIFNNSQSVSYDINNFQQDHAIGLLKYSIIAQDYLTFKRIIQKFTSSQKVLNQICRFLTTLHPNFFIQKIYMDYFINKSIQPKYKNVLDYRFKKFLNFFYKDQNYQSQQVQLIEEFKSIFFLQQYSKIKSNQIQLNLLRNISKMMTTEDAAKMNKEKCYKVLLKYLTFRENQFDATVRQKFQVVISFLSYFQCVQIKILQDQQNQILYLSKIIKLMEHILTFCTEQPFNEIKNDLLVQVILQYLLINHKIFTKQNPQNLFQKWSRIIYYQNKQNFFQTIYKLLKLRQGFKFLWYQCREVFYQNYELVNIKESLSDVWTNSQYLLKHLHTEKAVLQFLQIISVTKYLPSIQNASNQYLNFYNQLNKNQSIDLVQKTYIRQRIQNEYFFIALWTIDKKRISNLKLSFRFIQRMNSDILSEEHFHFCIYLNKIFDFINCRRLLNKIDLLINCSEVSQLYFKPTRLQLLYIQNNCYSDKKKSLQLYQSLIEQLTGAFIINQHYYLQAIKLYGTLCDKDKAQQKRNKHKSLVQKESQISLKLNSKMFLILKNIMQFSQTQKLQNHRLGIFQLFQFFNCAIRSVVPVKNNSIIYLYKIFKQYESQIRKYFQKFNICQIFEVQSLVIFSNYALLTRFESILVYIIVKIYRNVDKQLHLWQNPQLIQPMVIYTRLFYACQKNGFTKKQENSFLEFQKIQVHQDEQQILKRGCTYQQLRTAYLFFLTKIEKFLFQKQAFGLCIQYNAPTVQIFQHLYIQMQGNFQKMFHFLYHYTSYLKIPSNFAGLVHITQTLHYLYSEIKLGQNIKFLQSFFGYASKKRHIYQNPYWWIIVNIFIEWQKKHFNLLYKVANSFSYIIYESKIHVLCSYYMNMLRKNKIQLGQDLTSVILMNCSKKIKKIWKMVIRYSKINFQFQLICTFRLQNLCFCNQTKNFVRNIKKIYLNKLKTQYKNTFNF